MSSSLDTCLTLASYCLYQKSGVIRRTEHFIRRLNVGFCRRRGFPKASYPCPLSPATNIRTYCYKHTVPRSIRRKTIPRAVLLSSLRFTIPQRKRFIARRRKRPVPPCFSIPLFYKSTFPKSFSYSNLFARPTAWGRNGARRMFLYVRSIAISGSGTAQLSLAS